MLKDDVDRLVGPDRLDLIPGNGDDAKLVGLDRDVLAILLDDAAGRTVAVLHHDLVCPDGTYREACAAAIRGLRADEPFDLGGVY